MLSMNNHKVKPMCVPQKKGKMVCACSSTPKAGSDETFCDCSDMKASFEKRLSALEKRLEARK
jgi:hypothetical protein